MQPNNQAGVPPQAPQPRPVSPVPVTPQPQVPQPMAPQVNARGERVIQPLAQQAVPAPQPSVSQPLQPAAIPSQGAPQTIPQQPVVPVARPQAPAPQAAAPVAPEALGAAAVEAQVQNSSEFTDDDQYEEGDIDLSEPVAWQAAEFIHHEKTAIWYVISGVVLLILVAFSIYMQAYTFTAVLVVIAVVIGIYTRRPPHTINYALSEDGLSIDSALHRYEEFKSFGIIRDGEEFSVMLIPRKRFQPGITVYFPEEAGEDIVDVLGARLPMRDLKLDVVDKIVRKLRL